MRVFKLEHGWATKYLWLGVVEEVYKWFDFVQHIVENRMTFNVSTGTTEADCLGSTTAIQFYSEKVKDLISEMSRGTVASYKIETTADIRGKYFYLVPGDSLPRIQDRDIFSQPNLDEYCERNGSTRNKLVVLGSDISPLYSDISKWKGSAIFTVDGTLIHLVTEDLKNRLEKMKFKNIKFKEIGFVNGGT